MVTTITVLDNLDINNNGVVYKKNELGYYALYSKFIKRGITFEKGSVIDNKKIGRPRTSNKVQKTLRIDKKHLNDLNTVVKGFNMSDRILAKINEGDKQFKFSQISISLIEFWVEWFEKNDKK